MSFSNPEDLMVHFHLVHLGLIFLCTSVLADICAPGIVGSGRVRINVESSRVERNTATDDGGGFYVDRDSNVTLLNTTVAGNTAGDAGGIGADTRSQVQVESSFIVGNSASAGVGGGFSVGGDCTLGLVESTVTNNVAGTHGGKEKPRQTLMHAVCFSLSSPLHLADIFTDNVAGGVAASPLTRVRVENSRVGRNKAGSHGGGFFVSTDSSLTLVNATVDNNTAGDSGGACFGQGSSRVNMTGGQLLRNTATRSGGAVCLIEASQLVLVNVSLCGNSAVAGGGVALMGSRMSSVGVLFERNSVKAGYGGAIHLSDRLGVGAAARLTRSTLSGNSADRGLGGGSGCAVISSDSTTAKCGGGGAISVTGTVVADTILTLDGGTRCENNTASGVSTESSPGGGGCILAWGSALVILNLSTVSGNVAEGGDGGGLALLEDSTLKLSSSVVDSNQARTCGGGLFVGPRASASGTAAGDAAAVTLTGVNVFTTNTASSGDGGAFFTHRVVSFAVGQTSEVLKTLVQGNTAPNGRGGGLAVRNAKLQVEPGHSVDVTENHARLGGGVALLSGATLTLGRETCRAACEAASIGDGTCNPECFNRACVWDGGDCRLRLESAGTDATRACPRATCGAYAQTHACESSCLTASCDWSRSACRETRDAIRQCPLLDGVAFSAITARQQQSGGAPVFMVHLN